MLYTAVKFFFFLLNIVLSVQPRVKQSQWVRVFGRTVFVGRMCYKNHYGYCARKKNRYASGDINDMCVRWSSSSWCVYNIIIIIIVRINRRYFRWQYRRRRRRIRWLIFPGKGSSAVVNNNLSPSCCGVVSFECGGGGTWQQRKSIKGLYSDFRAYRIVVGSRYLTTI